MIDEALKTKVRTAEEAAAMVQDGDNVGLSGFTQSGCPKEVVLAIARRAEEQHAAGKSFRIGLFTGASTNDMIDGALTRAKALKFRTPYQSTKDLRDAINSGETKYIDLHLSTLPQDLRYGFYGDIDVAIIEAAEVTANGEIIPTAGVGISPTICRLAKKIIIEVNSLHPAAIRGMHDICEPADPPLRRELPIYSPSDRIGKPFIKVDPDKIVAIIETSTPNQDSAFSPQDDVTNAIGNNVAAFLLSELKSGRLPGGKLLPIQSGVGNIANAVLGALGKNADIPPFEVYTEVIQDAVIELMKMGKVKFASGCSLTISRAVLRALYDNLDFFKDRIILRPQEYSNNPEIIRRLGLITINTALEADIFGNINSTHINGSKMVNGIGGSGDFTRNAFISIFTAPSTAKGGKISNFVPMVSHLDHSEHSVKVIISEHGIADLRGLTPRERARVIIDNCAHPDYRPLLHEYLALGIKGQTPQDLDNCFALHRAAIKQGDMRKASFTKD